MPQNVINIRQFYRMITETFLRMCAPPCDYHRMVFKTGEPSAERLKTSLLSHSLYKVQTKIRTTCSIATEAIAIIAVAMKEEAADGSPLSLVK